MNKIEVQRKDFPEWKVTAVYVSQDGACLRCGRSLADGFQRHHKDSNRSNNSVENLELVCVACHRATFAKDSIDKHRDQERYVLDKLNTTIQNALDGKVAGAVVEKLVDACTMSLKVSRQVNELDQGVEYPPASIGIFSKFKEREAQLDSYVEGFRAGSLATQKVLKE